MKVTIGILLLSITAASIVVVENIPRRDGLRVDGLGLLRPGDNRRRQLCRVLLAQVGVHTASIEGLMMVVIIRRCATDAAADGVLVQVGGHVILRFSLASSSLRCTRLPTTTTERHRRRGRGGRRQLHRCTTTSTQTGGLLIGGRGDRTRAADSTSAGGSCSSGKGVTGAADRY